MTNVNLQIVTFNNILVVLDSNLFLVTLYLKIFYVILKKENLYFVKFKGNGAALFATYAASTLLHGLSAQLAAVLFSLGLYTWVEHSFR